MNAYTTSRTSGRITTAVVALTLILVALKGGGFDLVARHLLGVAAWVYVLVSLPFAPPPRRRAVVVGAALLAVALLAGLSAFWSESAERSVLEATRALTYLGLFAAAVLTAGRLGDRRPIVDGLTLGFAVVLLLAVGSRLEPGLFPVQELQQVRPEIRARLTYPLNYWNGLAAFAAMALPFFLHLATRADVGGRVRALGTTALPLAGLTLYLTFSRGGLVAALAATGVLLLASPARVAVLRSLLLGGAASGALILLVRSYRALNDGLIDTDAARSQGHRVLVALVVVSVALYFAHQALERFQPRIPRLPSVRTRVATTAVAVVALSLAVAVVAFADVGDRWESFSNAGGSPESGRVEGRFASASGNGRYEYWSAAVDAWQTRPLAGRGAGAWELWWQRHATIDGFVQDSHSLLFDTLAELGIAGLIAVLALLGAVLWAVVTGRRRATDDAALASCLLAATVAAMLTFVVDWTWEIPAVAGTLFVIVGLAAARGPETRRTGPLARRGGGRLGPTAAFALVAWIAIFAHAFPLLSQWQLERSQDAVRERDFDTARKAAERARSLAPWAAGPKAQMALVLRAAGRPDEALFAARAAVRKEPTNWRTWLVLANVEYVLGGLEDYDRHLRIARDLNPRSAYWQSIGFTPAPEDLPR